MRSLALPKIGAVRACSSALYWHADWAAGRPRWRMSCVAGSRTRVARARAVRGDREPGARLAGEVRGGSVPDRRVDRVE